MKKFHAIFFTDLSSKTWHMKYLGTYRLASELRSHGYDVLVVDYFSKFFLDPKSFYSFIGKITITSWYKSIPTNDISWCIYTMNRTRSNCNLRTSRIGSIIKVSRIRYRRTICPTIIMYTQCSSICSTSNCYRHYILDTAKKTHIIKINLIYKKSLREIHWVPITPKK